MVITLQNICFYSNETPQPVSNTNKKKNKKKKKKKAKEDAATSSSAPAEQSGEVSYYTYEVDNSVCCYYSI